MFSKELINFNEELKKCLGDDNFVSSVFDRKTLVFSKDYLSMSFEERCALCRFV